jgi:hypothetical protein
MSDQEREQIGSSAVPMRGRSIPMEDTLWAAAVAEAKRRDVSTAELVRQATAFYLGWHSALRAVAGGGDPTELQNFDALIAILSRAQGER